MTSCAVCGTNVTGKKFCPECGSPVQSGSISATAGSTCPQCHGEVKPGASFCMHCGVALSAATPPSPVTRPCPACQTQVATSSAFCTQCGHDMHAPAGISGIQCTQCGNHNAQGMRFCGACGAQLVGAVPARSGPYPAAPQPSYPQYPVQSPQYQQQPYGQGGYQQPMLGQQAMALRCPSCMAFAQVGSAYCTSCRTSLAGVVPTPVNMPAQGQQSGVGGFLQGNGGKLAIGALGGAAALLGGEMLINGFENNIENRVEGDMGFGGRRHHHRREEDEGMLGGLGRLADDIGLI